MAGSNLDNFSDPIINLYNKDENGNIVAKLIENEPHEVVGGQFYLNQLPDKLSKTVIIPNMYQVKDYQEITNANQFKVDYNIGLVAVHPSLNGQTIHVTYYGTGVFYYPASRIWAKLDSEGRVVQTIQDVYDKINEIENSKDKNGGLAGIGDDGFLSKNNVVKSDNIVDGSISTSKIANGAITDPKIGNRTVNDAITTSYSNTGTLTTILSWFAKMLKTITGKGNWYTAPSINLEQAYSHTQNSSIHMTSAEKTKLSNIADGATKVESSSVNGNIVINGQEKVVYTHPTNAGNKHIPSGGSTDQYLKYGGSSGTAQWAKISADDIETTTDKQFISQSEKTKLSNIADGATKVDASSTNGYIKINGVESKVYEHPNVHHLPTSGGGSGTYLKYAENGSGAWSEINANDIITNQNRTFVSEEEKTKLSNIADGATKVEKSSINGNIKINGKQVSVYTDRMGVLSYTMENDEDVLNLSLYTPKYVHLVSTDVIYGNVTLPQDVPIGWDVTIKTDIDAVVTSGTFNYTMYRYQSYLFVKSESGYHAFIIDASNDLLSLFLNCEFKQNKGEANGYAPLDNNKLIPAQYIPQNALSHSYANTIVGDAEGSSVVVTDVQEYTNARGLTIEGKAVEKPIKNLIPESALKFEQGTGDYGVWKAYGGANVTITQNQLVPEWGSTTATRIQTNGGTYSDKYILILGPGKDGVTYRFKIKIKNISTLPMEIFLNSQYRIQIPANTTQLIDVDRTQAHGGETLFIMFRGTNVNDNLDFYVEDPFMAEYGKTSDNPYEIIGVGESGNITTIVKTLNLIPNADFSNGTTNWKIGGGVLSVENGWLKAYHSLTASPSTVVFQDLSMSIPAQTKLFARIKMKVTHTNSSHIQLYLVGTDEAGTITSLTFEKNSSTLEAGKEYVFYGIITTSKDFAKMSYRAQQVFDSGDIALGSSLYIKDCLLINMGSNESNPLYNLTADEMNAKYPDFIPYGETIYETTLSTPLYALSDSKKDYVDITEGKVYKITNKLILNGGEPWNYATSQPSDTSLARFSLNLADIALAAQGICSHFVWTLQDNATGEFVSSGLSTNQLIITIKKSRMSSWSDSLSDSQKASLFKNWLAGQNAIGTPVVVIYERNLPIFTDLTSQTIPLYVPATNIATDDELMPTIRLTYNRDNNKVIADLQNQINQLKSAIALL